ncbi:MAG: hypothetical protein IJX78_05940 [Bacilli bacterium]|nr:hypothetical protein [Bacilli bacterium]
MSKKVKKDSTINKIYFYILEAIALVFVVALAVVLVKEFTPKTLTTVDKISVTELENRALNDGSATSFYVIIYTADNAENEMIQEKVVEYYEYAKKNEGAYPIFVIEYNEDTDDRIKPLLPSTFDYDKEFPCMITVSSNSISNTKATVSTILQTLEDAMNK